MQKSELQAMAAAAQVTLNEKTIADTLDTFKKQVFAMAGAGRTSYTWEARHLNMVVVVYDDTIIASICAKVSEMYPDSKVTSTKGVSSKNESWVDYTITVDWS